jgi:hypothetical protein
MMPQSAPYATPGPVQPAEKQKLPGLAGIWIGVVLVVVGVVVGIALVVVGARSFVEGFGDLQSVPIDGGGTVLIEDTGSQTVYAERPAFGTGSGFQTGTFTGFGPNVQVSVIGPDGQSVYFDSNVGAETYTFDQREGVSLGSFDAPTEGNYEIRSVPGDDLGSFDRLTVGQVFDLGGIFGILGGVAGGGLIVLIGIIVIIVSAVRRSRARKRQQPTYGYPPQGGGYGGQYGGPPGWAPPPTVGAPGGMAGGGWAPPPVAGPGTAWQPTAPPAAPPPGAPAPWNPGATTAPAAFSPPPGAPPAPAPPDPGPPAEAPFAPDPPADAPPTGHDGPIQ